MLDLSAGEPKLNFRVAELHEVDTVGIHTFYQMSSSNDSSRKEAIMTMRLRNSSPRTKIMTVIKRSKSMEGNNGKSCVRS